ncbi:MAG: hypothetical protein WCS73_04815 [Lentisphaeria bacterium]
MFPKGLIKKEIAGALLYSTIGMVVEIFVTGLPRLWKGSKTAFGFVSVLMFLLYLIVYWTAPFFFRLFTKLHITNRFLRAFCMVFVIYGYEWGFGVLCRSLGYMPWTYTGMKPDWVTSFSNGNITLLFFPLWYIYALIIEPLLKSLRIMVSALYDKNYLTWKKFWSLTANEQL